MRKNQSKRLLSWLLALAMVFSLLPGAAVAAEEQVEIIADACICDVPCVTGHINSLCPVCGADGADLAGCTGTAPEAPVCDCTVRCAEGSVKADCPVCGAEGAGLAACAGTVQEPVLDEPTQDPAPNPAEVNVITAFDWPEREQMVPDLDVTTLPETVDATVDGETASIPVEWTPDRAYDLDVPGDYTFTAVPTDGVDYTLDGAEWPTVIARVEKEDLANRALYAVNPAAGTISTNTTWSSGTLSGDLTIAQGVTLTLEGSLTISGTVKISGGTIQRGSGYPTNAQNGTIQVGSDTSLTLEGVTLDGNKSNVKVDESMLSISGGTVTMNSGAIQNCSFKDSNSVTNATAGFAVTIKNGTFTMNQGTIKDNSAPLISGTNGAVLISSSGIFNMNGGSISNNVAGNIGGIYVSESTSEFHMNGGSITGNQAKLAETSKGGVYASKGITTLSGNASITNNFSGSSGNVASNLYLLSGFGGTLKLSGALTGNAKVGVRMMKVESGNTVDAWAEGKVFATAESEDVIFASAAHFVADNTSGGWQVVPSDTNTKEAVWSQKPLVSVHGTGVKETAKAVTSGQSVTLSVHTESGYSFPQTVTINGATVSRSSNTEISVTVNNVTANQRFEVTASKSAAKITHANGSTTNYATIEAAIAAAQSGDQVEVLVAPTPAIADKTLAAGASIKGLNGKTYTAPSALTGSAACKVSVDTSGNASMKVELPANSAGTATFESFTYSNETSGQVVLNISTDGSPTAASGSYQASVESGNTVKYKSSAADALKNAASGDKVLLESGASVTSAVPVAKGVTLIWKNNGFKNETINQDNALVSVANGIPTVSTAEAKIGDTSYTTLGAAITAATDGKTVEILGDSVTAVTDASLASGATIKDKDGHTYKATTTNTTVDVSAVGAVTLKHGVLHAGSGSAVTVPITGGSSVTVSSTRQSGYTVTVPNPGFPYVDMGAATQGLDIDGVKYMTSDKADGSHKLYLPDPAANADSDFGYAVIPASKAATVKLSDTLSVSTPNTNSGAVTVKKDSVTVATSGDKVTVGGTQYAAAADGTVINLGADGKPSLGSGAVKLDNNEEIGVTKADGSSVAVKNAGTGEITVTANTPDGKTSVTVPAGGTVKIGDKEYKNPGTGPATFVIDDAGNVVLSAGSAELDQNEAVEVATGSSGKSVAVKNDSADGKKITVTAGNPKSTATVAEGGKATIGTPGSTYTAVDAETTFSFDEDGKTAVTAGTAGVPTDTAITAGTDTTPIKNTGAADIKVSADGTVTVPKGADGANKVTVGDPGTEYVNPSAEKDMVLKVKDGKAELTGGAASLDPNESINVSGTPNVTPVTNTGDKAIIVTANTPTGKSTVTVPDGGTFTTGTAPKNTFENPTAPAGDLDFVIDADGKVTVDLAEGEKVIINGVEYTGGQGGGSVTVAPDGTVTPNNVKVSIDPDKLKDPSFEYTLVPGQPVTVGDYVYQTPATGNSGADKLLGSASGNPIVALAKDGNKISVKLASDETKSSTYTAGNDNTKFTMSQGSNLTPATSADTTKVNLLDNGNSTANSALDFTGTTAGTVDGVTYAGEKADSAYTVTFAQKTETVTKPDGTTETVTTTANKVGTTGRVTATFAAAKQTIAIQNAKVGSEAAKNLDFTAGNAGASILIDGTGAQPTVTGGSRTNLSPIKDASGNIIGYEANRYSSGGGGGSSSSTVKIDKTEHGKVTVDRSSASKGQTVTITATPDKGYEVGKVTVTDKNGNTVTVKDIGNNKYTFTQPAAAPVTIKVTFEKTAEAAPDYANCPQDDTCPIDTFTDASPTAWYHDGVHYCLDNGLMSGTSGSTFSPNAATTRGMIVTILYRLEDEPKTSGTTYPDVAPGQYYTNAVSWAAAKGIVTGYTNGNFGPNDPITREQMAAILYRYAGFKGYDVSAKADLSKFTDSAQVSGYATDALAWANAEGLVTGKGDGVLDPKGSATRAQVATILMRFCETVAEK